MVPVLFGSQERHPAVEDLMNLFLGAQRRRKSNFLERPLHIRGREAQIGKSLLGKKLIGPSPEGFIFVEELFECLLVGL